MNNFDILYTINKNFIDIFLVSLYSVLKNSKIENIRIHLVTSEFELEDYSRIKQFIDTYDNVEIYFYPLEEYDIKKYNLPNWRGTQVANARLFFQDILNSNLDNIDSLLYLDSDTITIGDLNDIKKFNNGIYAAKDAGLIEYGNSLNLNTYYNSGVLYIDKNQWIDNDCQERIIHFLSNNNIKITFPDQDTLNCALKNKIQTLPLSYNLLATAYKLNGLLSKIYFNGNKRNISYDEVEKAKKSPKILHGYGLGNKKQWSNTIHPYYNIFMDYMKKVNPEYKVCNPEFLTFTERIPEDLYNLYLALRPYVPKIIKDELRKVRKLMR